VPDAAKKPVVVRLKRGLMFVRGNPTRDETLTRAAVDTAATALVFSKKPGDPHSDDKNIAITLAIEGRTPKVQTVVECVDFSAQELLKKAGCDGIVCTSRFDAHFLNHELLNPGVQVELNVDATFMVEKGDALITIGRERLEAF
jgi:voltage-gated potassium channel